MLPKKRNNAQILLQIKKVLKSAGNVKWCSKFEKVPSAIGTARISEVVEVVVVVVVAVLLVVVILVLVVREVMVLVVVVVVVVVVAAEAAVGELPVAVAGVAIAAITQLFVSSITWRVTFINVKSFAHLSSAQYSNRHLYIEH